MKHYLIFTSNPLKTNLEKTLLDKIKSFLNDKNLAIEFEDQLAENEAHEYLVAGVSDPFLLLNDIRNFINEYEIDVFLVEEEQRNIKKLLIADMDSTLIENECIDEIARHAGKYEEVSQVTEDAMMGKIQFEESLSRRVKLLKGVTQNNLEEIYKDRITLSPGVITLGKTMKKYGSTLVLASGGFTFFTNKVKERIHFDLDYSNSLEIIDDTLTGEVIPPIFGSQSKLEITLELINKYNISPNQVMAVGDGANDLPMLTSINMGIAYKAKWAVKEKILNQINHSSLTSLLYIQGIHKADFSA